MNMFYLLRFINFCYMKSIIKYKIKFQKKFFLFGFYFKKIKLKLYKIKQLIYYI